MMPSSYWALCAMQKFDEKYDKVGMLAEEETEDAVP